jgi:phospholipid N-methyltransferase
VALHAVRSKAGERRAFLRSFLANPREVGAVLPTSRRAVRDTLDLAPVERASLVVEFGAGSGVYTRELLLRMAPDARLLAFEVDEDLAGVLAAELDDPRLEVITASAEQVERHLDGSQVDVVVSALPFTSLPAPVRHRVLDLAAGILGPHGALLVLQYSPFVQRELERRFSSVERRFSPLNLPPAVLFRCTKPLAAS